MPKYVKNNRTVKEIMDEIQNERERNPELNEKMGKYEKMFQGWYQDYFTNLYRADLGGFDSYIQLGGLPFMKS